MSESLVTIVDRAMSERKGEDGRDRSLHLFGDEIADIIHVIEPHLRRKYRQELLDELIADAESTFTGTYWNDVLEWFTFQDWLASHKEAE